MATRTRDIAPGKQKRGTSPSNTTTTANHRGRPSPSKTASPADPTAPEKRIPNYLRPTISSRIDDSKQHGKKPLTNHTGTNNTTVSRRRSLDKSPSPSTTQKPHVSPNPGLRSSLFSGTTVSSHKLVSDKNSKAPKDVGKKNIVHARPIHAVKKSTICLKKQEGESRSLAENESGTSVTESIGNPNVLDSLELETKAEDMERPITEVEQKTLLDESDDENKIVVREVENPEPENNEKVEVESDKDAKTVAVESPKVEHHDTSLGAETEKLGEKSQIEVTASQQQELELTINQPHSYIVDETVVDRLDEGVEEKETEEPTIIGKNEEVDTESEAHELKETEVQEVTEEKEKQDIQKAPPKQQVAHGKKESAVSNDVIEETASKLREQRKNRVRALAGAFETVISLQEPQ